MRLSFQLSYQDGTVQTVSTRPVDLFAWERYSGRSVMSWATEAPDLSAQLFLAWAACTHEEATYLRLVGVLPPQDIESLCNAQGFNAWLPHLADHELAEVNTDPPTPAGNSGGSSP